jgi:hypothetical protein
MQLFLLMEPQEGNSHYTNRYLRDARRDVAQSAFPFSHLYLSASRRFYLLHCQGEVSEYSLICGFRGFLELSIFLPSFVDASSTEHLFCFYFPTAVRRTQWRVHQTIQALWF